MSQYLVYGLFTRAADGQKRYFYVGKTRRSIATRIREHVSRLSKGHEDVYNYLRRLDDSHIEWSYECLRFCAHQEYVQDAERYEVIRLLRLGHDLCNMRYGDANHKAELARQTADVSLRSVADVMKARLATEYAYEVRRQVKNRGRLRRKALIALLKEEGISSVENCNLIPAAMRRRLTINGDLSIYRGCSLAELVRHAREYKTWTAVRDLSCSLPFSR